MPNITVLRVSSKTNVKKPIWHFVFWLGLLVIVILIYVRFFFDSIVYLEAQSVKFIRTTNLKAMEAVLFYTIPVFNLNVKEKVPEKKRIDNVYISFLDFKKILQEEYPVLPSYISEPVEDEKSNIKDTNEKSNSKNEIYENENKNSKIYSKTVNIKYGGINIRNHTKYKIDIKKMLSEPLKFSISSKGTQIIIVHTHTTEAYVPENNSPNTGECYRTTNSANNVTRIGLKLKKELEKYGMNAVQDTTIHDYPEYLGSYSRALKTIIKDLKKYPQTKMVLDIHRDAYGETEGRLRAAVKINGSYAAKIMFVVGTDGLGLQHKAWRENLKLAIKLQSKANKMYPGLCREIDLRKERFNQHSAPGALIVEVGGTGNTAAEAEISMKYLAGIISETMKTK